LGKNGYVYNMYRREFQGFDWCYVKKQIYECQTKK
jgi:hypothetical protein